jgi:Uma2 family endonuclease
MAASAVPRFTHDEFLEREQQSPFRHEYIRGHIEMMAGGSERHALLCAAIVRILDTALLDRDCRVYGDAFLLRMAAADISSYPDAMVVCGQPNFVERRTLVLDNPIVVVEVLSPSTEDYDLREKLPAYQQVTSLKEILFLSQDKAAVQYWYRQDGGWESMTVAGMEAVIPLRHLAIDIRLADLYRRIDWTS